MSQKFITPLVSDVDWKTKVLDAEPTCLAVVDVHAQWCGPCTGLGKRLINLSGDFMDFDIMWCEALAEKISIFHDQAGKSRPLFVFYKGGKEIARINEANGNELQRIVVANAVKKA